MRYKFTQEADLPVAAGATGVLAVIDAVAGAVLTLETLLVGGRSADADDRPAILRISRGTGVTVASGTAATLRVPDEPAHTAAARAGVTVAGPTVSGGTEEVLDEISIPVQGTMPLGVPMVQPIAKTQAGDVLIVRVVNPAGNTTVDFRISGTVLD